MIVLYTIGFTKKDAAKFFSLVRDAGVKRILDIRLNNTSQLAGFTKKNDLAFFAREICRADYVHLPQLAPTQDLIDDLKKRKGDWEAFEAAFNELLENRQVEKTVDAALLDGGCLLCSEDMPEHCHRRLVAEYFQKHHRDISVVHLV